MRGGALPPGLLACALGLALAFAPRKAIAPSIGIFATLAIGVALAPIPRAMTDAVFYACWASIVVAALSVNLPKPINFARTLLLAANAGVWSGAVISVTGAPLDLAKSVPVVFVCLLARWVVSRKGGIAVKVVASWLIAVSVLAAALPTLIPTPGYVGDHLE